MSTDKHGRWWADPLPPYDGPFSNSLPKAVTESAIDSTGTYAFYEDFPVTPWDDKPYTPTAREIAEMAEQEALRERLSGHIMSEVFARFWDNIAAEWRRRAEAN